MKYAVYIAPLVDEVYRKNPHPSILELTLYAKAFATWRLNRKRYVSESFKRQVSKQSPHSGDIIISEWRKVCRQTNNFALLRSFTPIFRKRLFKATSHTMNGVKLILENCL